MQILMHQILKRISPFVAMFPFFWGILFSNSHVQLTIVFTVSTLFIIYSNIVTKDHKIYLINNYLILFSSFAIAIVSTNSYFDIVSILCGVNIICCLFFSLSGSFAQDS